MVVAQVARPEVCASCPGCVPRSSALSSFRARQSWQDTFASQVANTPFFFWLVQAPTIAAAVTSATAAKLAFDKRPLQGPKKLVAVKAERAKPLLEALPGSPRGRQ